MIAIVGCGTLGSRLAHQLEGHPLLLIDHDIVRPHNIGVQNFSSDDVGAHKAATLAKRFDNAVSHSVFLDRLNFDLLKNAEVICDCTDNLLTRKLLSRFCVKNGIPLVHAAAAKDNGVVALFTHKPCLECVYEGKVPVDSCRSTDINLEVADKLANRQAELAKSLMQGDGSSYFALVSPSSEHELNLGDARCKTCQGDSSVLADDFYITYCTQAGCMSAKPIRNIKTTPAIFGEDGITANLKSNGEIHFSGSEDADVLLDIANRIYNSIKN